MTSLHDITLPSLPQNGSNPLLPVGLTFSYPSITESGSITVPDTTSPSDNHPSEISILGCTICPAPDTEKNTNNEVTQ